MQFGIVGQKAPELNVNDWINAKGKATDFKLSDHEGEVRVLFFFQSWCPGCHSRGFPLLEKLIRKYDDVAFAVVQTVFEGYDANKPSRRLEQFERYDIADIPMGHDEDRHQRPSIIRNYKTGGTPWFVVIDKSGIVIFNDYHADFGQITRLIDEAIDGKEAPMAAEDKVRVDKKRGLLEVDFAGGGTGRIDYDMRGNVAYLMHSEVPRELRGGGYGGRLMETALGWFEEQGIKVHPVCSYTRHYLSRYQRWHNLVA